MSMMRHEVPKNTPDQVLLYLRAGLEAVEDLDPPADLREAVFTAAVNLVSAKQIIMQQAQGVDPSGLRNGRP